MPRRTPTLTIVLLLLLPLVLVLGLYLGGHPRWLPDPIGNLVAGGEDRRVSIEALDTIHDRYYREVPRDKLTDSAIGGAVEKLGDRFSAYFTPKQYADFEQSINNEFSGIGTAITTVAAGLRIELIYPKSPARKAGLRVGDVITEANGRTLAGLAEEPATALIKGPEGTKVTLRVRRGRRTFTERVTRATISVPVVSSKIANAGGERVAYIALSTFGPKTAHVQVAEAIRKQRRRGAKGIVLDLRDNGGGLVTEAQLIASMFLENGVVVTTRGRAVREQRLEATGDAIAGKLPTVVLVNRNTASAAEIVAGALQDRKRAKLVGTRTFGKGVFQEILPLDNGGALDITVGQYFLPSGRNLGGAGTKPGAGIRPDVRASDDRATPRDEALARALDVLAKEL